MPSTIIKIPPAKPLRSAILAQIFSNPVRREAPTDETSGALASQVRSSPRAASPLWRADGPMAFAEKTGKDHIIPQDHPMTPVLSKPGWRLAQTPPSRPTETAAKGAFFRVNAKGASEFRPPRASVSIAPPPIARGHKTLQHLNTRESRSASHVIGDLRVLAHQHASINRVE